MRQLRPFASRNDASTGALAGSMRFFTLTHPHLSLLLMGGERKELERLAKLYESGSSQSAATEKYSGSCHDRLLLRR